MSESIANEFCDFSASDQATSFSTGDVSTSRWMSWDLVDVPSILTDFDCWFDYQTSKIRDKTPFMYHLRRADREFAKIAGRWKPYVVSGSIKLPVPSFLPEPPNFDAKRMRIYCDAAARRIEEKIILRVIFGTACL